MKKLLPLFLLLQAQAIGPTDFSVSLPDGLTSVKPSIPVAFNLIVRGCDSVSVTVNGTNLGVLNVPYRVSFTSASGGNNTIVVTACNDRGFTTVTTNTIQTASTIRYYSRRLYR